MSNKEELIATQKKEKKDLLAKTQKMKHSVPKGDKKKKKEITAEIAQLLADLDMKHEKEMQEFEEKESSTECSKESQSLVDSPEAQKNLTVGIVNHNSSNHDASSNVDKEADECEVECNADKSDKVPRISKAQKRRNKKAMLEKERNRAIAEEEIANLNSMRHKESENIKIKLSRRNLKIYEIPSDGNCLYKAVEHQLSTLGIKQTTVQALRDSTSNYMLSHTQDFIPFLTHPESGDVLTEEQYVKYCEDIANTAAWGGHIEIQVLSNICGFPIEVIQSEGPSIISGDHKKNPKLILSYHRHVFGLGEHYNSVVSAESCD